MKRLLVLAGLCVAIGCSASDSGSPATTGNSTSQIQTMDLIDETVDLDEVVLATKNVSFEVEGMK